MNINRFISLPIFLIALAIGTFLVYISAPTDKNIYVYPTPENLDKFVWQDGSGTCFGWEKTEVNKPTNLKNIKTIPVQN